MAMANGEDDVSILSQLTEKTLKEATSRRRKDGIQSSDSSIASNQSGMTSRSKTQAAVREVLKEVSIQHNQAMKEQHDRFQKELEALRQALANQTAVAPPRSPPTTVPVQEVSPPATMQPEEIIVLPEETTMEVDDSSDA
mmetsp:Transcript_1469/g.2680  ORF Transcript_1469/g.2680 Transcript_1469/m.2680 type:complete len:140 (+) Transcript_1469:216-635(+)